MSENFYTMSVEEVMEKFEDGLQSECFIPLNQFIAWLGLEEAKMLKYLQEGKLQATGTKLENGNGYKNICVAADEAIRFMAVEGILPPSKH